MDISSWSARHKFETLAPLKTCPVEELNHVKSVEAPIPSCGMVVCSSSERGWPAQVLSSTLNRCSKLPNSLSVALVLLHRVMLVNTHSHSMTFLTLLILEMTEKE
ncbi:hypothetical protein TNCV_2302861 [Trichonephila clavipes]|nr:hypothetical protein TNCV_2302861 [Trichonephila clavipes]